MIMKKAQREKLMDDGGKGGLRKKECGWELAGVGNGGSGVEG